MNNKKSKVITIILLFMTIVLMIAIFYIGYVLTSSSEKSSPVAPRKTKAQSAGYNKFIALDTTGGESNNPTPSPTPIFSSSPTPSVQASTPTPTEVILANQYTTLTPSVTRTASTSATPTAKAKTLPQTGFITNAIVLFGISAVVIFISFIF